MSGRCLALAVLVSCALLGAPATAQSSASGAAAPDRTTKLLEERQREYLHAGTPVELIGIDEGGADFRKRSPTLEQSDLAVVQVDPEENYQRRLAMYDQGQHFHAPLAAATSGWGSQGRSSSAGALQQGAGTQAVEAAAPEEQRSGHHYAEMVMGVILLLLGIHLSRG